MIPVFRNTKLLTQALTHPSSGLVRKDPTFERLEFLGDRVLGMVIAEMLYIKYPKKREGELAKEFARLVRKETCKAVFVHLKLHEQVKANDKEMNMSTSHIISDACEAFLGALFLDQGYDAVKNFTLDAWAPFITGEKQTSVDEKSTLQEYIQKRYKTIPIYELVHKTGTEHEPKFTVSVTIPKHSPIEGDGPTRRLAEKQAAKNMLLQLKQQ